MVTEYGTKGFMFGSDRIHPDKINQIIEGEVSLIESNKDYLRCHIKTKKGIVEGIVTVTEDGKLNIPGFVTKRPEWRYIPIRLFNTIRNKFDSWMFRLEMKVRRLV